MAYQARSLVRSSIALRNNLRTPIRQNAAAFSTSRLVLGSGSGEDMGTDKTHMADKSGGHKDIQSEASNAAHEDRASGSGSSQATSQKDVGNNNERAEKDHPEAPKPVIGMNDERGGKGH